MSNSTNNEIVVKRQNFDAAMRSIRNFSERAAEREPLDRVSSSGGLFGLGDHKVTGTELNSVVSQVEDQLMDLKGYDLESLDLITDVYKALDALDKEHISGILIAANAAKAASDKATKNVAAIEKIVKILKDYKEKLEKIHHLTDVDEAWKLLNEQQKRIKALGTYQSELAKIKHLQDVDNLWDKVSLQAKSLTAIEKELRQVNSALDAQKAAISGFTDVINSLSEGQQSFVASVEQRLKQYQEDFDSRFDDIRESQTER